MKSRLIGKDPDAGKDWGQEEKGVAENEMVGWHHRLNGHEFEQAPGDSEGQGSLACCSPWGRKESNMTSRLNNNNNMFLDVLHYCALSRWQYSVHITFRCTGKPQNSTLFVVIFALLNWSGTEHAMFLSYACVFLNTLLIYLIGLSSKLTYLANQFN